MTSPFAPPETQTLRTEPVEVTGAFYVVSETKLAVLYVGTMGLYSVYWFYKHWKCRAEALDLDVMPWARGLFSIFFAHALFRDIRTDNFGKGDTWDPHAAATLYVFLIVTARVLEQIDRFSDDVTLLTALATFLPMFAVFPMLAAQRRANQVCGDPAGTTNASFSAINILFLVLFSAVWMLVLVGFAATLAGF